MPTLNAADFSNVDPLVVSGWGKPTGSVNTRVITLGDSQKVFTRSSSGTAIFQHLTPISSPVIRVQWLVAQAQANNQNQKGGSIVNLSTGSGYCAIHNGGNPGTVEIRAVTSGVMGATALASAAATNNSFNDLFYADYDTVTGEWKVYQAPEGVSPVLKLTYSVTPMSTTDLVGGMLFGAASTNIVSFTVQAVGGAVTSIDDPVVIGETFDAVTTGFSTVTTVSAAGMSATGVSFLAGAVSGTWPDFTEGQVLPISLPAAAVQYTFGDGAGGSATIDSGMGLPAEYQNATEMGTVVTDTGWLGASVTINSGNRIYAPANYSGVGNITVYPDGNIATDSIGTFPAILHRFGDDDVLEFLNITRTVSGVGTAPVMPDDDTVAADAGDTSYGVWAATSGTEPITYTLTGDDAGDFTVNSSTAALTSGPAVAGSYSVNVVGTNAYGSDSTALTINVAASAASIDSVGTVRIGGTTAVTVSNFIGAVNAGTLDDIALTSASNTSITVPALVDGQNVPRPGTRALDLTDGSVTGTTNVTVNAPTGWSSYTITGLFVEAINGVAADYLPVGWAVGDFILSPNAPDTGKTTTVGDSGVITSYVGTQELFLVDAATGLATAFDIVTTAGAGSIGGGGAATNTLGMRAITMRGM